PGRVQLPRRAQRRLQDSETTTEKSAFRLTADQRLRAQRHAPTRGSIRNRLQERMFVITVRVVGSVIEARGSHWTVECNPFGLLPKVNLQRGEVAEADDAFRLLEFRGKVGAEKIARAVPAARGHQTADPPVPECAEQSF